MLSAIGLKKSYDGRQVVNGVDFEVQQGEVVGLLGPNGAGKTTSFYMVVGLVRADGGQILLNNEDITHLPLYKRSTKGLAYLPQEASVFRRLSVEDNIKAVLEILPSYQAGTKHENQRMIDNACDELIESLNLNKVRKSFGFSLSGGERRRVEIARALACSPKYILLDEPFAGIDPIVVGELQKIVRLLKDNGMGILITDHNVRETLGICDRAYILTEGRVIESGAPDYIANSEIAKRFYLGENFSI